MWDILIQQFFDGLHLGVEWLNGYSTLILTIITSVYVYFTYSMSKTMAKQLVADIKVSGMILNSTFKDNWFKNRLKNETGEIEKTWLQFRLFFDVRNSSSGSGSIDKPRLVLRFTSDNFEYEIRPRTKEVKSEKLDGNTWEKIVTDLGGTVFLRGGESKKVELEYTVHNVKGDLLQHIKENLDSLEYRIYFTDNLGKNYVLPITTIRPQRDI